MLIIAVGHLTVISIAFSQVKLCPLCLYSKNLTQCCQYFLIPCIHKLILMIYHVEFDLQLKADSISVFKFSRRCEITSLWYSKKSKGYKKCQLPSTNQVPYYYNITQLHFLNTSAISLTKLLTFFPLSADLWKLLLIGMALITSLKIHFFREFTLH